MIATIRLIDCGKILLRETDSQLQTCGFKVMRESGYSQNADTPPYRDPAVIVITTHPQDPWYGLKIIRQIREIEEDIPVIFITTESTEELAIAALKLGINDYFSSLPPFESLLTSIKRLLSLSSYTALSGKGERCDFENVKPIIGESSAIREVKGYILKVAATHSPVLITGETGTGKELVAELIHNNSPVKKKPFIAVNCAALPESLIESELFGFERGSFTGAITTKQGKFELANEGTLFLDEIGDMPFYAQSKILRAIEKKEVERLGGRRSIPVNVRIIAATNQDPEKMVREKRFREDLYYRLNVARISLPPLRERKEDILRLIDYFIHSFNGEFGLSVKGLTEEALSSLLSYDWPGNVRELKNILEAAFINRPQGQLAFLDLPRLFQNCIKEMEGHTQSEREMLISALFQTRWNKSHAARKLKWSRMKIYRKMTKYNILTSNDARRNPEVKIEE